MQRRRFLRKAAAGAVAASTATGLAACGGSAEGAGEGGPNINARPTVRWRLASSFPRSLDTIYGAAEKLSETLEELTDGRFQMRVYPAGELVPGTEVLDAAQKGTVQCAHSASYYFIGKDPTLAFDCAVPFGLTARQQSAWLYSSGMELMRERFADFNVLNFPGGNTGTQMGGWFRREINSVADLNGLKMRIPGLGGQVMDRFGVSVQLITGGEIYQALERGAIDAAEWVGPYDDIKLGFDQVASYYYYPGWWEPGPGLSFYVNREAWDKLPAGYQAAFTAAARVADQAMMTGYDAKNPAALAELKQKGSVELRRFSDEILQAAQREAFALMEETAAGDAGYRKVFEAWKQFREDSYAWFSLAENGYSGFALQNV